MLVTAKDTGKLYAMKSLSKAILAEPQHGHLVIAPLALPQLASCASSGRARWPSAARHSQGAAPASGAPSHRLGGLELASRITLPKSPIPLPVTVHVRAGTV